MFNTESYMGKGGIMNRVLLIIAVKICLDSTLFYALNSKEKAQAVRHTYKLMEESSETNGYIIAAIN